MRGGGGGGGREPESRQLPRSLAPCRGAGNPGGNLGAGTRGRVAGSSPLCSGTAPGGHKGAREGPSGREEAGACGAGPERTARATLPPRNVSPRACE